MPRSGRTTGRIDLVSHQAAGAGSATTMTGNFSVTVNKEPQNITFQPDAAVYPTLIVNASNARQITIESFDAKKTMADWPDGPATIIAKIADAKNASGSAGSGQITYTLVNAIKQPSMANHAVATPGTSSISYVGYSADGTTDPLTITEE